MPSAEENLCSASDPVIWIRPAQFLESASCNPLDSRITADTGEDLHKSNSALSPSELQLLFLAFLHVHE